MALFSQGHTPSFSRMIILNVASRRAPHAYSKINCCLSLVPRNISRVIITIPWHPHESAVMLVIVDRVPSSTSLSARLRCAIMSLISFRGCLESGDVRDRIVLTIPNFRFFDLERLGSLRLSIEINIIDVKEVLYVFLFSLCNKM